MLVLVDQSPNLLGDSGDFLFFPQGFQGDGRDAGGLENVAQVTWRRLVGKPSEERQTLWAKVVMFNGYYINSIYSIYIYI